MHGKGWDRIQDPQPPFSLPRLCLLAFFLHWDGFQRISRATAAIFDEFEGYESLEGPWWVRGGKSERARGGLRGELRNTTFYVSASL